MEQGSDELVDVVCISCRHAHGCARACSETMRKPARSHTTGQLSVAVTLQTMQQYTSKGRVR